MKKPVLICLREAEKQYGEADLTHAGLPEKFLNAGIGSARPLVMICAQQEVFYRNESIDFDFEAVDDEVIDDRSFSRKIKPF